MNTIGRSMDDLFWRLPVMAYLWVVLCCISPDICLRWEFLGVAEAAAADKGQERLAASLFGLITIWSNHTPFPFHHFTHAASDIIFQCYRLWQSNLMTESPLLPTLTLFHFNTNTTNTQWKLKIYSWKSLSFNKLHCRPVCQGSAILRHGKEIQICGSYYIFCWTLNSNDED